MLVKLEHLFQRISYWGGRLLAVLLLLMTLNVCFDVIKRYFFHNTSIAMQEMEWHLFSVIILFGISIALLEEAHVRVDFLYDRYSKKNKALINIIGTIMLLLPLALLVFFGSFGFVQDAWEIGEISEDPGGLHYRWLIKGMIPLSFGFLILCSFGYVIKNINLYRQARLEADSEAREEVAK